MCDTMTAMPSATRDGSLLFAKNSDREPNEPHVIIRVPGREYGPEEKVKCTYIEVDQRGTAFETILFKPHWIWGAEMGVNQKGLVLGNEAVFTKEKVDEKALLGMDILRLALERCATAGAALELITALIESYGQGGRAGYTQGLKYHNSYLIADFNDAFVLETAGRHWAYRKIKDIYSISNALTIRSEFDGASGSLVENARSKGWCRKGKAFDFKDAYEDRLMTRFARGDARQAVTMGFLKERAGTLSPGDMMEITRHHGGQQGVAHFRAGSMKSVCMHGGGLISSQTTGSMVVRLKDGKISIWATGSSLPCISLYKPLWFTETENAALYFNEERQDAAVEHWRHIEAFHRMVLTGKINDLTGFSAKRDAIEDELMAMAETAETDEEKIRIMKYAYAQESKLIGETLEQSDGSPAPGGKGGLYYRSYWRKQNRLLRG